ncbi:MAG TPA: sialidase family protein [bacterium]|nr:sialidase family protein [bacterium]
MSRIRGIFLLCAFVYLSLAAGGPARAQEVTFGSPRDIAEIGFSGLAQFANGFTLNRFAINANGTLEAAILGVDSSQDPQELPMLSVSFAQDQGAFLPPIVLSGEDNVVELIASVEMDSANNLHAFSSRVENGGSDAPQMNVVNSNSDATVVGDPIPLAPGTEPDFAQLFSNTTIDAEDNLHVVFSTLSPDTSDFTGPLYYVRSGDGGATWSPPKPVVGVSGSQSNNFIYPSVAAGADGETVVVSYFDANQNQIRAAKSSDGGASFPTNEEVFQYPAQPPTVFSKVAMDAAGKIYVAYSGDVDDDPANAEVLLSTSTDGASYGQPVTVNQEPTNFEGPIVNMAVDSRGRIDVIWHSDPDGDDLTQALNFARSTDGGATFSSPVTIATAPDGQLAMNGGIRHDRWGHVFVDVIYAQFDLMTGGSVHMVVGTPDDLGAPENCGDSSDNDYDGAVDCDDTECEGDAACVDDSGIGGEAEGGGCSISGHSSKLGWAALFPATGLLLLLLQRRKARASSRA